MQESTRKHIGEGELKTYLDGELGSSEMEPVRKHLEACPSCQQRLETQSTQSSSVNQRLDLLASSTAATPVRAARARFDRYIERKEKESLMNKIFARKYRLAWAIVGLIAILGISMAFPPVQAIANSFLGLFRVKQVAVVQVNSMNLPNQLGSSSQLESIMSKDVKMDQQGTAQEASSAAEASSLSGITVRLPAGLQGTPKLTVQPGGVMTFKVDLQQIRGVLAEIGRSDVQLPDSLDGSTLTVNIPKSVVAQYGDCTFDPQKARQQGYDPDNQHMTPLASCTTLIQMPSPTINTPPGLDIAKIGEAYLEVLGMSPQDAQHFSQNIDWTSTLVIPVPRYGTSYRDVTVDGVNGTAIQQDETRRPQFMVMWVKDGLLYALTGPGNVDTGVAAANSLK